MNYQFRDEIRTAKKAAMGEIVQLAKANSNPGDRLINFASGHPSTEIFQDELIKKCMGFAAEEAEKDECNYGGYDAAIGYAPLREHLKRFINADGNVIKQDDDMMLTYGSTEAVYLAASVLIESGDKVIVEEPSYVNAIKAFRIMGGEVVSVRLDEDGVNLEDLERIMQGGGKTVLYYA